MTSPSLTLGTTLLAFSPTLTLFFLIILPKPQLTILSVVAAFAYLISALGSSLFWLVLNAIFQFTSSSNNGTTTGSSIGALLALTVPSVILQHVVRVQFVKLYFSVEDVIRKSVAKHEAEENDSNNSSNHNNNNSSSNAESNALQLQLNDTSTSLASGTGYALLHLLFLFGTLLASESHEGSLYYGNVQDAGGYYGGGGGSTGHGGTLYQPSCGSGMPSLVNGALVGMMFSILDVCWMMLTFFGMRRRRISSNSEEGYSNNNNSGSIRMAVNTSRRGKIHELLSSTMDGMTFCTGMDDTRQGGNAALGLVLVSHFLASLVLAPNGMMEENGCRISLPCLGGVVVGVVGLFVRGVKGHFLPLDQRSRIQELRMSGSM